MHIVYQPDALRLLDQTRLPQIEAFLDLHSAAEVADAIARLCVRGAPAIGICAAYGLAIEAHRLAARPGGGSALGAGAAQSVGGDALLTSLGEAGARLVASRPTAVNLAWAVGRMLRKAQGEYESGTDAAALAAALDSEASAIHAEDIAACRSIGAHGATFFRGPSRVRMLTHCNTGDLATGGYGTALGVIRSLWHEGRLDRVFVDETRPVLQGARLTAWELQRDQIPYTLIADNMAGHFMQRGAIDAVIVGADRIARNGDTANKIGTYALSVLAKAHGLPFLVAAPRSTFDPALETGDGIVIEERAPHEMTSFAGARSAPPEATVANPAFDVTPAANITGIVTESGLLQPPLDAAIARMHDARDYADAAS